jgi:hypothetical protein
VPAGGVEATLRILVWREGRQVNQKRVYHLKTQLGLAVRQEKGNRVA